MAAAPLLRRVLGRRALTPLLDLAHRVRTQLRARSAARTPWMRHKLRVDEAFDAKYGIDTGGIVSPRARGVQQTENLRHAVDYIASDPAEFERALCDLDIAHERFTFVDIGCGKGRALLLAAELPFKRLVGVELSPVLADTARRNLQRALDDRARAVDVQCRDALTLELPDEPLVLFMYNPFGRVPMQALATKVQQWHAGSGRELYVVYTNPFHADIWASAGFREVARGDLHAIFAPVRPETSPVVDHGTTLKQKLTALVTFLSEPFSVAAEAHAECVAQLLTCL